MKNSIWTTEIEQFIMIPQTEEDLDNSDNSREIEEEPKFEQNEQNEQNEENKSNKKYYLISIKIE